MPVPTPESVEAIAERLKAAVTAGTREPTAILTAEEHRIMLDLHLHDPTAAGVMLSHIREHARTLPRDEWSEAAVNRINFQLYVVGARAQRARERAIDTATNIVRMGTQRMARARRGRNHVVSGEIVATSGMSPAQMQETESIRLIALGLLLTQRHGRIWYDTFHKRAYSDWLGSHDGQTVEPRAVTDSFVDTVTTWLHESDLRLVKMNELQVHRLLGHVAHYDTRNEPRDWLAGLQWDGVARLGMLMTRGFGANDSAFNREAGRCWFVSMCARIHEPGVKVDTMPVFIGGQGLFKSMALEVIGGNWYRAASSGVDAKDFLQELHGALVFEIPELHSMISSRHGAAKIKAVLSTRIDHFRLPYARTAEDHKRTAVMAGTTNNRDWHSDETGARRYWPVHVGNIDLDWLRENRAQLFAEADAYYRTRLNTLEHQADTGPEGHTAETAAAIERGKWWNVPSDEQAALMDAETAVHPYHDMITTRLAQELAEGRVYRGMPGETPTPWDGTLSDSTEWGNTLTVTRVAVAWLKLSPDTLGRGTGTAKTIGAILRGMGWESRRIRVGTRTERPWVFVRPENDMGQDSGNNQASESDERPHIFRDDEDIPF